MTTKTNANGYAGGHAFVGDKWQPFITRLGADCVRQAGRGRVGRAAGYNNHSRYGGMLLVATAVTGVLGWLGLWLLGHGVRADYLGQMGRVVVMAKQAVPLLVVVAALPLVLRLATPEARVGGALLPLLAAWLVLPLMAGVQLAAVPVGEWWRLVTAASMLPCVVSVPVLSLGLTAAQIFYLRGWAVTQPVLTGGIAGVLSGGVAVVIYALFCPEDAPAFYGLWYSLGMLTSGGLGAVAGWLWLRW